ncbi:MAG: cupin domain-containing protein [Chitinophagales bacterium]|jgi:quercetin dioxygenase-like cupin family protein|nr:cupin domain-containing protein [Chitinophagaceae bacterium]MBP9882970.1 cupin domain-containing protein [Chitinophagales bacterium]
MPYIQFDTRKRIDIWPGISGTVYHSEQATFGYFDLEAGVVLAEHQHPHEQWTHLIEGTLEFNIAGEKKMLKPGMAAFIPSNTTHSAIAHTACKVIDCFLPVREEFRALELKD